MSALHITLTHAGYAALVNAQNTGTNSVLVNRIGVTEQAFDSSDTAAAAMTSLPGELKQLSTFAGDAVADDTIHVTIRDDGSDSYTLRGFGLYLADGTLLALYGQADAILEKSAQAMLLLAVDIRFTGIDAAVLEFGDTNWINPPGTTQVPGVLQLATAAQASAGTDNTRAMTPATHRSATDARFGAGAPTTFVKGLLSMATAALFRTALGIKGAALKDEGAGNGLNADLLDGQHGAYYRDYRNLTQVPSEFPPSSHGHNWADIALKPATATRWPKFVEVVDKPSSYPPAAHTHAAGDIRTGEFDPDRIPSLQISKISGLSAALNSAVRKAGDVMSGNLEVLKSNAVIGVGFSTLNGGVANYGLDGTGDIGVFSAHDNGRIRLRPGGRTSVAGEMRIDTTGISWDGHALLHRGIFDPDSKADKSHSHTIANIPGLQSALDGKQPAGNYANALHTHSADDIQVGTLHINRIPTLEISKISGLQSALDGKQQAGNYANALHTHSADDIQVGTLHINRIPTLEISKISGLQLALDGKQQAGNYANASHTHSADDIQLGTLHANRIPTLEISKVSGLQSALEAKAPIASPTFTGTVRAPIFRPTSSRKVKRDIRPMLHGLAEIMQLDPATWLPLADESDQTRRGGLVAEDVRPIIPEAVDDADVPGIDYAPITAALVRAVQELATEVRQLCQERAA